MGTFAVFANGGNLPLTDLPILGAEEFRSAAVHAVSGEGMRVLALFALPEDGPQGNKNFLLIVILGDPAAHRLNAAGCRIGTHYPALTCEAPAFQLFERELYEEYGIVPEGHPWLKPVRFCKPAGAGEETPAPKPGITDYFTMKGDAVHEVAVGPIHAGVIEPGHFRFQCFGEEVSHLEIELGYQHRGVERALVGGPDLRTFHLMETAAGDSSCAEALACAAILESGRELRVPERAQRLRTLALALERIANHTGDLGALAGDVAFLPTASFCGRIRGEFLNMTATLCGNRFGRGLILPGGVGTDPAASELEELAAWLKRSRRELEDALELMFDSPSVLDRLENTGTVSTDVAAGIGMVGVAGRASGLSCNAAVDFPLTGAVPQLSAITGEFCGDVLSRAKVRRAELTASLDLASSLLKELLSTPAGPVLAEEGEWTLAPRHLFCSVVEAWRGELCHVAVTDGEGKFRRYKIVDPSCHNWFGLAQALRGNQISDFPICNKSFNLSYCGHDL